MVNFLGKMNQLITQNRKSICALIVLLFVTVNEFYDSQVKYYANYALELAKPEMISPYSPLDDVRFQEDVYWALSLLLQEEKSDNEDVKNTIKLLEKKRRLSSKKVAADLNDNENRLDAQTILFLSNKGSGSLMAGVVLATAADVLNRNYLVYAACAAGIAGVGVDWYVKNSCKEFLKKYNEL